MEKAFKIGSVILIGVAAFFLYARNFDGAFVTAALGCVSFFLSVRARVKTRVEARNAEILAEQDQAELDEAPKPVDSVVAKEEELHR